MILAQVKHFTSYASSSTRKVLREHLRHAKCMHCACCICLRRVLHIVFLISLVLEQTSEGCIGNTERSDINVNDECNSK